MEGRKGGGTGAKGTNGPDECGNHAGKSDGVAIMALSWPNPAAIGRPNVLICQSQGLADLQYDYRTDHEPHCGYRPPIWYASRSLWIPLASRDCPYDSAPSLSILKRPLVRRPLLFICPSLFVHRFVCYSLVSVGSNSPHVILANCISKIVRGHWW